MRWGNFACMERMRNAYKLLARKPEGVITCKNPGLNERIILGCIIEKKPW
jgi:hypothetical protein